MFTEFLQQSRYLEMFITGPAGTGKTTMLAELVKECQERELNYVVCAFTHKACDVLRTKLPTDTPIRTLHSFLKKRPGVNQEATHIKHVDINAKTGTPDRVDVLFIDEFSMVGEKDLMDIRELQDEDEPFKIVWIGDLNQLPPVGDQQTIRPHGPFQLRLTKIHRQANTNPLLEPLAALVDYIEGKEPPAPLQPNQAFRRGVDIVEEYFKCKSDDKLMLAYTNERVEALNATAAGRAEPCIGDLLFSPTVKRHFKLLNIHPIATQINRPWDDSLIELDTKYKTLEHLHAMQICDFATVQDLDGEEYVYPFIFGHYQYKLLAQKLKEAAVQANQEIEREYQKPASEWARANPKSTLARKRAKAWRDFLTFNDCVICLDFPYAMTIHKAQGSTYEYIFLDSQDLDRCIDTQTYLKLFYVALSRASKVVYAST